MAGALGNRHDLTPDRLDEDPARYSFSWPTRAAEAQLRESLVRFGPLRPLLAVRSGAGLRVVAGARRLRLIREIGLPSVPVQEVNLDGAEHLWDLLLEDHLLARPLNPVEVGLYATKRPEATGEDREALARSVLPRLGLPPKAGALDAPLWIAGLPDPHKDAFAEGRFPASCVRLLARAPRDDALAVLDLLGDARLNGNKFSEASRWLLECAWREGCGVSSWALAQRLDALAGRGEELRRAVWGLRFPNLAAWEASFEADTSSARLPARIRLSHAPGFEGGRLTAHLSFSSLEELESLAAELGRALGEGRLSPLEKYLS